MSEPEPIEAVEVRAVQVVAPQEVGISPFDLSPEIFKAGLDRRKANRDALLQWIADALKKGEDYGSIHVVSKSKCEKGKYCTQPSHWSKPVLFKPGAEKINSMLGLTATYRPLTQDERRDYGGIPLDCIVVKCELVSGSGRVVTEGLGARLVDDDGDVNKALKMAEKSSRINATLQLGLSDTYTQDLEDMVDVEGPSGQGGGEPLWPGDGTSGAGAPAADLTEPLRQSIEEVQSRHGDCPCGSPLTWKTITKNKVTKGNFFCLLADMAGGYEWASRTGSAHGTARRRPTTP